MKTGNGLEGTPKIVPSKKLEWILPLMYLGLGYEVGKKVSLGYIEKNKNGFNLSQLEAGVMEAWEW